MIKVYYVHLVNITTKSIILYNIHCKKEQGGIWKEENRSEMEYTKTFVSALKNIPILTPFVW